LDPTTAVSKNLAQLRKERGLTLQELATLSKVSKAMLGQIERGESNPTINVLWKIATGLCVPLNKLLYEEKGAVEFVPANSTMPLRDHDGMRMSQSFSFDEKKHFEVFSVTMDAKCIHSSDAHARGSEEYILLIQGQLEIQVNAEFYTLQVGDSIRFASDKPHVYRNPTESTAWFQNMIYYST